MGSHAHTAPPDPPLHPCHQIESGLYFVDQLFDQNRKLQNKRGLGGEAVLLDAEPDVVVAVLMTIDFDRQDCAAVRERDWERSEERGERWERERLGDR